MIAQAVVGIAGVTLGQYGSIAVDVAPLDPEAPVVTDLANDAFAGFRTFLAAAAGPGPARARSSGSSSARSRSAWR